MQTFLPYPSFIRSAASLDKLRLGNQRKECIQILRVLAGIRRGWANHPAVRMWRGHGGALAVYGLEVCAEWVRRGGRDECAGQILALATLFPTAEFRPPPWLGDEAFHRSHREALACKAAGRADGWVYVWPV